MRLLRSPGILALAVALGATAVVVAAGLAGLRWITLLAVVVAVVAELRAQAPPALDGVLLRAGLDRLPRSVLRMFGVLALLAGVGPASLVANKSRPLLPVPPASLGAPWTARRGAWRRPA